MILKRKDTHLTTIIFVQHKMCSVCRFSEPLLIANALKKVFESGAIFGS